MIVALDKLFGCFVRMLVVFRPFRYAPAVLTFLPVLVATQGLQ